MQSLCCVGVIHIYRRPPPVIESILGQNGQILVTGGVCFLGEKGYFLFMGALIFNPPNPATTPFAPSQPPSPRPATPTRPNTPSPLQPPSRAKSLLLGVSRKMVKSLLLGGVYYWGGSRVYALFDCVNPFYKN